jgi:multidrug efflux pump subunit AcrA (membrane-fusion protein)
MKNPSENSGSKRETADTSTTFKKVIKTSLQFIVICSIIGATAMLALFINSAESTQSAITEEHSDHSGHKDNEGHSDHKEVNKSPGHDDHGNGEMGEAVLLDKTKLKNASLTIETAGSVALKQKLLLNGIITPNEETIVNVSPRYPGVVKKINKRLGSRVEVGDVLLTIESDQSLKQYTITSSMAGTIINRRVSLGEHVDLNDKLMIIADLRSVWVDFRVYPRDFKKLKINQDVEISMLSLGPTAKAKIEYISPIGVSDTQSMLARTVVDNSNGNLRPGLFVTGQALLAEQKAFVAVRKNAVQYIEGKPVVFIEEQTKDGSKFIPKNVELGPSDENYIEIYFGVLPNQRYVSDNSFMLKAELSKSMAAHSH